MTVEFNNLSAVSFKMAIKRLPDVDYRVQNAMLPGLSLGTAEVPSPFTKIPMPGNITFDDLTVSFLVGESMKDWYSIYKWMIDLGQPEELGTFPPNVADAFTDISMVVLSNGSNPIIDVKFIDAFPVNLSPLQFDVTISGISYVHASATFRYRWMDFDFIS